MITKPDPSLYPKFRTKRNRLTAYAFACGYIEKFDHKEQSLVLWKEAGCIGFHVRQMNLGLNKRVFWDCPSNITAARKRFDAAKRAILKGETTTA